MSITNKSALIILFILAVISYWKVPFIFFQQDEWMGFALIIGNGSDVILRGLGTNNIIHFVPLIQLINYLTFSLFHFNYTLFNITGLLIHLINSFLVFNIATILLKNKNFSLIAAAIFLTSSSAAQTVMWPMVSLNTVSLTLTLIVLKLIVESSGKINSLRKNILVALFTFCAILTLEYSLGLLVFVPLALFLEWDKKNKKKWLISLLPVFLVGLFYLILRLYPLLGASHVGNTGSSAILPVLIYKMTHLPFRFLGQIFISEQDVIALATFISDRLVSEKEFFYAKITTAAGIIILFSSLLYFLKAKKYIKNANKLIVVFIFILTCSLPFIFVPGQGGEFLLFPSRYLYYGAAGGALFLVWVIMSIFSREKKIGIILMAIIVFMIVGNIWQNYSKIDFLYNQGLIREAILRKITRDYPVLPKRTIIFVESDTPYYGLPPEDKTVPFQSGFGQTLLVWYYPTEKFPKTFYQDKFLWEITEQGYREINGRGFGYYWNKDLFIEAVNKYNLSDRDIVAFSWKRESNILVNITENVQKELHK